MANERYNTALDFETMLRRHLKSGGAPVAACAGFDFDAASAYLEDALGESHRAGYESHLAGCATCRRHLIELARLAQTAPHAGTQPATVADQTPAWIRWRGLAAGWFDLSSWNLKWRMAGAAGAAFAILIAALGVQSWRQASNQSDFAARVNTEAPASMAPNVTAPTPEPSPQGETLIASAEPVADRQAQSRVPVPTPPVAPSAGDVPFSITPSNESLKLSPNSQSGILQFDFPPLNSRQDATTEARRSNAPQQGWFLQQNAPTQIADSAGNASNLAAQSRIIPPGINPVNTEPLDLKPRPQTMASPDDQNVSSATNTKTPEPESSGKTQTDKFSSRLSKSLAEIAKALNPLNKPDPKDARTLVPGNKPDSKSESVAKEKPKAADDESSKPLKHRIRDKVFVYRRDINMWIDQDYKEETMLFRVLRLRRDTKAYEDVLAKDPQLKEFFEHGPILVVWKNKIYRVR